MTLTNILNRIEQLEHTVADLYAWLSRKFSADHEASAFFWVMHTQELSHAGLVQFERRLVRSDPDAFANVEIDTSCLQEVEEQIQAFRRDTPEPLLKQALMFAMKVESHAAENLHRNAFIQANPDLKGLIASLAHADEQHYETLRKFAQDHKDIL